MFIGFQWIWFMPFTLLKLSCHYLIIINIESIINYFLKKCSKLIHLEDIIIIYSHDYRSKITYYDGYSFIIYSKYNIKTEDFIYNIIKKKKKVFYKQ